MKINCLNNTNSEQRDVVIVTVPWTNSAIPLMAPAALKPIVEKAGLTCLAVDLNAEIYGMVIQHPLKEDLIGFFFDDHVTDETKIWFNELFTTTATQLLSWNPQIVCLSVFSYVCKPATKWLAYYIKKFNPNVKIIIGGAGCIDNFTGPASFANQLLENKLVDYHVRGDAEHSLYELLKGNINFSGINSPDWKELSNEELARLPMPNYDDYDFNVYEKKALPLLGSRGCVRKCTFCDIIANWKKFQWRSAEDIFNEMVEQYRKYRITNFKFQDSLTNGSQKEFRRLCEMLAEYNKSTTEKFKWSGYYIFREWTNSSSNDWRLVAESGAEVLHVGIENLNQDLRFDIGKKFSNHAIDLHLEMAYSYNIQLTLLNIVGHVTETREHIDFIKKWLASHTKYKDLVYIEWGGTLGIFPNTYLEKNKDKLGIIMIDSHPQQWTNPSINSTPELRAGWAKELNEYSTKLGFRVFNNIDNHYLLEMLMNA
jgi:radical SAM superfamily enzyme YgiQ (UPF0313 family)